jgi:hypothetical protein
MNFADTNWLEAIYFESPEPEQQKREALVQRFMRKHGGQLAISQIVYLEARNVFSRTARETEPEEWRRFVADFGARIYLDPLNWDSVRRDSFDLFARYAPRATVGTLDIGDFELRKAVRCNTAFIFRRNPQGRRRRGRTGSFSDVKH